MQPAFLLDTQLARALMQYFRELETRLQLKRPIDVHLAGGMAVHLYIGIRSTNDIHAEFGSRIVPPADLIVHVPTADDPDRYIYLDTNYNPMFSLLHEDYQIDSIPHDIGTTDLRLRILSPLDLAVSKIARFQQSDQEDIAGLIDAGLVGSSDLEKRAEEAIAAYIGNVDMIRYNLRDAVSMAKEIEARKKGNDGGPS
jgi:hypothetical protein